MADNKYTLDQRNFNIRRAGRDISRAVWKAVKFVLTVVSLTIVGYAVFALVYSTDEEKRLKAEIETYEQKILDAKEVMAGCAERKKQIMEKWLK